MYIAMNEGNSCSSLLFLKGGKINMSSLQAFLHKMYKLISLRNLLFLNDLKTRMENRFRGKSVLFQKQKTRRFAKHPHNM